MVNEYSNWFAFLKVGATCNSMAINSDKTHHININASTKDSVSMSFFRLNKIMDQENMTPLPKFYETLS